MSNFKEPRDYAITDQAVLAQTLTTIINFDFIESNCFLQYKNKSYSIDGKKLMEFLIKNGIIIPEQDD